MRLLIVCAAAVAFAASAHAVPGVIGRAADAGACFERVYDDAHLARNPAQTVTRIRISVSRELIPGSVGVPPVDVLRVELARRGDSVVRRAIGWCQGPFGGIKVDALGREIGNDADGALPAAASDDLRRAIHEE